MPLGVPDALRVTLRLCDWLLDAEELAVCDWDGVKLCVWLTLALEVPLGVPDALEVELRLCV